ncbi:MAG: ABC transporter permease [Syntrophobacteraceae bacterium]
MERGIVLPWRQVARIALNSFRVRFYRSVITVSVLTLSITFVVYILEGYELTNSGLAHMSEAGKNQVISGGLELTDGRLGISAREIWLAILSLLVCVTGILNAHLIAVTERFREIGTLKCLGALNSIILKIFLLEATYQGVMAGIAGGVLGVAAAILSALVDNGVVAVAYFPFGQTAAVLGYSLLFSVFLSVLGVSYPALIAARMRPSEAMRSEQ